MSGVAPVKIFIVAGARPNFVKIAALSRAFQEYRRAHPKSHFIYRVINTGQHYDYLMSKKLFQDLEIPKPYRDLEVGSSSHGRQTATIMSRFEALLMSERPHLVIVVGDVNSTMACSLVATKLHISVAHVESGLRSFDRSMPEEINRLVTDSISDILFTTSEDANRNLEKEGVPSHKVFLVGNVMVDSLLANLKKSNRSTVKKRLSITDPFAVLTLHRPSNVDRDSDFEQIVDALEAIQKRIQIIFPAHPRTMVRLKKSKLGKRMRALKGLVIVPPVGYLDFIHLLKDAKLVLTDSGGIQEECTVLNIPCLTLRDNTERPITIRRGTNALAGCRSRKIIRMANEVLNVKNRVKSKRPPLWDGRAAKRSGHPGG